MFVLDNTVALRCIHLETGVFLLFLIMVLSLQLARSADPTHYVRNARGKYRWFLAVFVLLSLAFAPFLYSVSPLLAVELAAGFTLALLHPVNALCLFVHMLFLRPWELLTHNTLLLALPRLLGIVCVLSWLMYPQQRARPLRQVLRPVALLLAFSAWSFFSCLKTPGVPETLSHWFDSYFKSLLVFVMCLFSIESDDSISEFELTLVISTLALMGIGLYEFLSFGTASGRLESLGLFADSNDLAAVIVMAIPFAMSRMFGRTRHGFASIAGLLFSGFSLLVIWFTRSRGALLAIAAQIFTAQFLSWPRVKWLHVLLIGGVLSIGYAVVLRAIPRNVVDMEESTKSRVIYWKAAINMAAHHPAFGVGFGQYQQNYESYSSGVKYERGKRTAHSSWMLAFAESGLLGGLLYIAFFLTVLKTAWHNRHQRPDHLYAVVGYLLAMSFLSHTYSIYPFMLAGLVLASVSVQERVAL